MSNKAHPERAQDVQGDGKNTATAAGSAESEQTRVAQEQALESMRTELESLKEQLREQQLRNLAELDNVRKRAEREIANGQRYGAEKLLRELLAICDSLELGLKAAGAPDASAQGIVEGLSLTHRQFLSLLEKNGVTSVDPAGQPFNPDLHEAVAATPSDKVPANHVLEVVQKGYRLHDRLLRPARVVVAQQPAATSET